MKAERLLTEAQKLASLAQSKSFWFSEKYPQNKVCGLDRWLGS